MRALVAFCAALLCAVAAPAAVAGTLHFPEPQLLPNGDPETHPFIGGGEPSLGFDPTADGHVYVTAPQGIPTGVGGLLGVSDASQGVGYWVSSDHGKTWSQAGQTGAFNGGGDSDVEVLRDHTVLVADLEAAAAAICTSHDFGQTFPDCDGGVATNQQGPENDRQWLTRGVAPNDVYLTYHDFAGGYPIIERSTDGGQSFSPCGVIIDPAGPAAQNYTPAGGTLVSKPLIGPDGTMYVEFTTPDLTAAPVGASLNHLYIASLPPAEPPCTPASIFKNTLIYEDLGADLGKIFQQTAIDAGGTLYVFAGGTTKAGQDTTNVWLFTSKDKGAHWSEPIQVNPPNLKANVFPTIAGGQDGEAILGWFGTETSGDPNTLTNKWHYYAAATYDGGKTFNVTQVTKDVIHDGDICTQGVFCGLIPGQPGNRNLADFASAQLDPADGCAAFAIPGDPYNNETSNNSSSSAYFTKQDDTSACLTKANSGKNAATVGGNAEQPGQTPTVCVDRIPPVSKFTARRSAKRRGVVLNGRTTDAGCGTGGTGKVAKVYIALGKGAGPHACRYLKPNGRFYRKGSCLRTKYIRAKVLNPGKPSTAWRFTFKHRLPAGRYVAWIRAYDASGNIERKARTRNHVNLRIR